MKETKSAAGVAATTARVVVRTRIHMPLQPKGPTLTHRARRRANGDKGVAGSASALMIHFQLRDAREGGGGQ